MTLAPRAACAVLLAGCAATEGAGALPPAPPSSAKRAVAVSVDAARSAALRWLDALGPRGLVLELHGTSPQDGFSHCDRSEGQPCAWLGDTLFQYRPPQNPEVRVQLGFKTPLAASSSLADLRARGPWVALDRLPTPGLDVPSWEIFPQTPVSSFDRGIEITGYDHGRIRMSVRTQFFALVGRRRDCHPPADAPMPADCGFDIERNFPLDLRLDLPMSAP
jgi:hypothetical protein